MAQTDTHNEALPAHRYRARKLCFLSLAVVCTVLAVFVLTFSLGFTSRPSNVGASYPQSTSSADVLLVMSYDENDAGTQLARDGVLDVLGRSSVNIDIVYMDAYHAPLQSTAHATWANRVGQQVSQRGGYDIVICCDDEALGFVEQNHDTMFAATPVVFFGVNDVAHAQSVANSGYATGMIEQGYVGEIMQVTYRLHPDATSFTAIVDQTPAGIGNKAQFVSAAQDFEDMGVYYVNTSAFTRNELGEYVSSASPDTIMFLLDASVDNSGNVYATDDTIAWVSSTSSVPVYCVTVGSVGSGAAGSSFLDPQQDGRKAAEMAITVLNGTSPSAIPLVVDGTHGYVFDQQVLNSYGISVADVPAGSTVVNRQLFSLDTLRIIVLPLILLVLAVIFFLQSRKMRHLQVAAEAAGVGAGTAAPVVTVPVESVVEEEPAPVVNAVAEAVAEAPVAAAVATPAKQVDASAAKRTKKKQLPAKERRRRDTKRGHQRQLRHTHPVSVKAEDAKPAPEDDEKLVTGHDELLEDVATIEVVADETPEEIEVQVEASAEGAVVEELEETPAEADDVLDETPEEIEAQVEASAEGVRGRRARGAGGARGARGAGSRAGARARAGHAGHPALRHARDDRRRGAEPRRCHRGVWRAGGGGRARRHPQAPCRRRELAHPGYRR